jgi:hypothetical protein
VDDTGAAFVVLFFDGFPTKSPCAQFLYQRLPKLPPQPFILRQRPTTIYMKIKHLHLLVGILPFGT